MRRQQKQRATIALASTLLLSTLACGPAQALPRDVSHSTSVELRLGYLSNMLDSHSGQRLMQHHNGATYREVISLFDQAKEALANNQPQKADELAKRGFRTIMVAIRDLPDDSQEIARLEKRYQSLRQSIEKLIYAEEDARDTLGAQEGDENIGKGYDLNIVNRIIDNAAEDAKRKEYEKAVAKLNEVYRTVTASIKGMMNNRTVVIELDISTPEKEYFYELRRFQGYEELIPVAIDVKKPSEMITKMLLKAGDKANWMAEQARSKAIEGDYPVAIRMMMDATMEIKNSLRLVGVNM